MKQANKLSITLLEKLESQVPTYQMKFLIEPTELENPIKIEPQTKFSKV